METLHSFLAATRLQRQRNQQRTGIQSPGSGEDQGRGLPEVCWVWPPCLTVGQTHEVTVKVKQWRPLSGAKCYVLAVIGDTVVADSMIRPGEDSIT